MINDEFLNNDQILKIDLFVLETLKELLLHQNLGFIDIRNFVDKEVLDRFKCIMDDIEMRIMYNYGMGFLELLEINENEIEKINEKCKEKNIDPSIFFYENNEKVIFKKELFRTYFLEAKINAAGLKQIEFLKKELKESKGLNYVLNKLKNLLETLNKIKIILGFSITGILVVLIFVFDIKVSNYIKKMPLLSSIINTEIIEAFENVNENDEFYKEIKKELEINKTVNRDGVNEGQNISKDFGIFGLMENKVSKLPSKSISTRLGINIDDIKVKNVSTSEKIFRITLDNGDQKLIKVKRNNLGKFSIELPRTLLNYRNKK